MLFPAILACVVFTSSASIDSLKEITKHFQDCTVQLVSGVKSSEFVEFPTSEEYIWQLHTQLIPVVVSSRDTVREKFLLGRLLFKVLARKGLGLQAGLNSTEFGRMFLEQETRMNSSRGFRRPLLTEMKVSDTAQRFRTCLAQIYDVESIGKYSSRKFMPYKDRTDIERSKFLASLLLLRGMLVNVQEPQHIVFHLADDGQHPSEEELRFYGELPTFYVKSHFFSVKAPGSKMFLVCHDCHNQNRLVEVASGALEIQWKTAHRNLHGGVISVAPDSEYVEGSGYDPCSGSGRGFIEELGGDYFDCTYHTIGQTLNATITSFAEIRTFAGERRKVYGFLIMNNIMTFLSEGFLINSFFDPFASEKFVWLTTAERFESYSFIVVVDKNQLNFSIFWRPFDGLIWGLYHFSLLLVPIVIYAFSRRVLSSGGRRHRHGPKPRTLGFHVWMSVCIILEQCQQSVITVVTKGYRISGILVLAVWLIANITIDGAYKGKLFSFLSKQPKPTVPETLAELTTGDSLKKYLIGTMVSVRISLLGFDHTERKASLLKYIILQSLMKNGTHYPASYDPLYENVVHLPHPMFEIVYPQIRKPGSINYLPFIQTPDGAFTPSNFSFPPDKNLAIVDRTIDLKALGSLFQFYAPNSIVTHSRPIDAFTVRVPTFTSKNFLATFFADIMSRLYESGIHERWEFLFRTAMFDQHFRIMHALHDFETQGYTEELGEEEFKPTQVRTQLFHEYLETGRSTYAHGPKPLSFDMFLVVLILFVSCCGVSVLVLIGEIVLAHVWSNKIPVIRLG